MISSFVEVSVLTMQVSTIILSGVGIYVLKIVRKSRKKLYLVLFFTIFLWFTFFDFITEKEFNVVFNIIRSFVFISVHAFFYLVVFSKDNNTKNE